jgi:MFS family permease
MTFESYRQILQHRPFRLFWIGFTFSVLGDAITHVALTWFVYETTRSAEALGWLMLCYTGPVVVGGLLAGWLLDRFDRRKVILVDNVIRGTGVALIPLLFAYGQLALWHIYAVAALYGLLMMISLAGGPALIPTLVRREQLATANALEMLSFTLGGVIGPIVAGLLIAAIGAPNVVIIDAVSYFTFALLLAGLGNVGKRQEHSSPDRAVYHLGHAVQLLLKNKILLATTCMFMAFNIGSGLYSVWLPILSDQGLGGGARLYGVLLGALACGEVAGAVLAGSRTFRLPLGMLICLAQALAGVALGLVLLGPSVWSAGLGLALCGGFSAPLTVWAQTLRMQIIPDRLRGRMFALLRTLMQSGNPIGGAIAGLMLPILGMTALIALSALVIGIPGLVGYRVGELRRAGSPGDVLDQPALVVE